MINRKQQTVRFYVDDLLLSYANIKVIDHFDKWLNKTYGSYGEVKCTRGKVHDYLGMNIKFTNKGKIIIDMCNYLNTIINDFSIQLKNTTVPTPVSNNLFAEGESKKLNKEQAEELHTIIVKELFLCKRV